MANTVSVSYQSIGPCIKYVCGHDGNVWDSKVFVSPAQLGDRLFQEILEQHAKYSALGKSSLEFFYYAFKKEILRLSMTKQQLRLGLDIFRDVIRKAHYLLRVDAAAAVGIVSLTKDSCTLEDVAVELVSDVSWFFDGDGLEVDRISEEESVESVYKSSEKHLSRRNRTDDIDIAIGLQHCLPEDFNCGVSIPAYRFLQDNSEVSLPMRLALDVVTISGSYPINGSFSANQSGSTNHYSYRENFKKKLKVMAVSGVQCSHSAVFHGGIAFNVQVRYMAAAMAGSGSHKRSVEFSRVAIVAADTLYHSGLDGSTSAIGTSQQALDQLVSTTIKSEDFEDYLRKKNRSNMNAVQQILLNLKVDLFLCSKSSVNDTLFDVCRSCGTVVLPMTEKDLHLASSLSGAIIVHNIFELHEALIGQENITLQYIYALSDTCTCSSTYGTEALTLELSSCESEDTVADIQDEVLVVLSAPENRYTNDSIETVTTVVLFSTTRLMLNTLTIRFGKCLNRLYLVANQAVLTYGGGIPELVAALELKRIVAARREGIAKKSDLGDDSMVIEFLGMTHSILFLYVATIYGNIGAPLLEITNSIDHIIHHITAKVEEVSSSNEKQNCSPACKSMYTGIESDSSDSLNSSDCEESQEDLAEFTIKDSLIDSLNKASDTAKSHLMDYICNSIAKLQDNKATIYDVETTKMEVVDKLIFTLLSTCN